MAPDPFWRNESEQMRSLGAKDIHRFALPLARIKRIMRFNPNVEMISSATPAVLSKACEMLISQITIRAYRQTLLSKRSTVKPQDVGLALGQLEAFDFLVDILPPQSTPKRKIKEVYAPAAPLKLNSEVIHQLGVTFVSMITEKQPGYKEMIRNNLETYLCDVDFEKLTRTIDQADFSKVNIPIPNPKLMQYCQLKFKDIPLHLIPAILLVLQLKNAVDRKS